MNDNLIELNSSYKESMEQFNGMKVAFDPETKEKKIAELEGIIASPGFWDSKEKSQVILKEMNSIKPMFTIWNKIIDLSEEIDVSFEILNETEDPDIEKELERNLKSFTKIVGDFELALLLSEKYDSAPAILTIHPGAGGTESQDWAEMLSRMFVRFAEIEGYKCEVLDKQPGDVAGIKSITLRYEGFFAYGYLKCERGVHRLVRISPFDSNKRRHTSFASIDVSPEVEDVDEVEMDEKDLKIDTYRASGAGGQHVNKTDSAIRITHLPSGIVVQCQNDRSQHSNRANAMKVLKSKLFALQQKQREEEISKLSGNKMDIAWGSQIRSYVFHPYQMVKDVRTSHEVGNINSVMDGNIMQFIESFLRFRSRNQ